MVACVFPLRRRVMPRRGVHNEGLQLLMGPQPPSVQWPHTRPPQPPKGSGKGRGRSQPAHSEVRVPKPAASTTLSSPAESICEDVEGRGAGGGMKLASAKRSSLRSDMAVQVRIARCQGRRGDQPKPVQSVVSR